MNYEIDIIIDSTITLDLSEFSDKLNIQIIIHDESIKKNWFLSIEKLW